MILGAQLRRVLLVLHVGTSVAALGAIAAFLALSIVGVTSRDPQLLLAVYLSNDIIARVLIVPMIFASLLVGVVQSLGTQWGLFRHWWIVAKLALNIVIAAVLLVQMPGIHLVAETAASGQPIADLFGVRMSFVIHSGAGLLALVIPLILSIYKPRGLTRFGWRKQYELDGH